jgi:hypothetical protein
MTLKLIRNKVSKILQVATGTAMSTAISVPVNLISMLTLDTDTILAGNQDQLERC